MATRENGEFSLISNVRNIKHIPFSNHWSELKIII